MIIDNHKLKACKLCDYWFHDAAIIDVKDIIDHFAMVIVDIWLILIILMNDNGDIEGYD